LNLVEPEAKYKLDVHVAVFAWPTTCRVEYETIDGVELVLFAWPTTHLVESETNYE